MCRAAACIAMRSAGRVRIDARLRRRWGGLRQTWSGMCGNLSKAKNFGMASYAAQNAHHDLLLCLHTMLCLPHMCTYSLESSHMMPFWSATLHVHHVLQEARLRTARLARLIVVLKGIFLLVQGQQPQAQLGHVAAAQHVAHKVALRIYADLRVGPSASATARRCSYCALDRYHAALTRTHGYADPPWHGSSSPNLSCSRQVRQRHACSCKKPLLLTYASMLQASLQAGLLVDLCALDKGTGGWRALSWQHRSPFTARHHVKAGQTTVLGASLCTADIAASTP